MNDALLSAKYNLAFLIDSISLKSVIAHEATQLVSHAYLGNNPRILLVVIIGAIKSSSIIISVSSSAVQDDDDFVED